MPPRPPGRDVQRRPLVRVLAVAQHRRPLVGGRDPAGEAAGLPVDLVVGRDDAAEPGRHRDVVGRGVPERLQWPAAAGPAGRTRRRHRCEHVGVAGRVDDDRDRAVVLRAGAHHRRAADVDLLDDLAGRRAARDRLGERVEVRHQQLERRDAELGDGRHVLGSFWSASSPACTCGCSVLTRPPRISGKPVTSSTAVTGMPSSRMRAAVEPVDTISTPASCSPRASSSSPVLS